MLVMLKTDLVTMKNYALINMGLLLLVSLFICIGTGTLIAGIAAFAAMLPSMYVFSIVAYDEMNGWERFRLTLPISRKQVVAGRYASVLVIVVFSAVVSLMVGAILFLVASMLPQFELATSLVEGLDLVTGVGHLLMIATVILVITMLVMPLFMRYGMTKAVRVIPLAFVIVLLIAIAIAGNADGGVLQAMPMLEMLLDPAPEQAATSLLWNALIFVIALVPYGISAFVATRLYERRQF